MLNRETAIDTAKSFITDLRQSGYQPTEAWLFGSVINGNIHAYSDIDLALWDKNFTGVLPIDIEKLKKVLVKYSLLEIRTYPAALTEQDEPFIGVIKKTGERIL